MRAGLQLHRRHPARKQKQLSQSYISYQQRAGTDHGIHRGRIRQYPGDRTAHAPAPAGYGETLAAVQARGTLICGVNGQLPGFSYLDSDGSYSGFDVDFCG